MSKFLEFREQPQGNKKTKTIYVFGKTNHRMLGQIIWHAPWRRYTFVPNSNTVFDVECLKEIQSRLETEMEVYKVERA